MTREELRLELSDWLGVELERQEFGEGTFDEDHMYGGEKGFQERDFACQVGYLYVNHNYWGFVNSDRLLSKLHAWLYTSAYIGSMSSDDAEAMRRLKREFKVGLL